METQAETQQTLAEFKAELADMTDEQRGAFLLARGEILDVVRRYPVIGLMAIAYVGVEEAAKLPDLPASG